MIFNATDEDWTAYRSIAHPDPIQAYANAQGALERLEDRCRLSPVRRPWKARIAITERQALARIDNSPIGDQEFSIDGRGAVSTSAFDLSHWRQAIGAPISLTDLTTDGHALLSWLGVVQPAHVASFRDRTDIMHAIAGWHRDICALPPAPPLLHGARIARLWQRHAPIGQGDLGASLLIGDRWGPGRWAGSTGGLVALGLDASDTAWKMATDDALDPIWLNAITIGARLHLDMEMRLRAYARRAAHHIDSRRRAGRLKDVLSLAMTHPRITSGSVAKALGMTVAGVIKLIDIAVTEGLLIEQTGQASYRSYAIPVSRATAERIRPDPFDDDRW